MTKTSKQDITPHTTHHACDEIMQRDGGKAVGCCCTGHECKQEASELDEQNISIQLQKLLASKYDITDKDFIEMLRLIDSYTLQALQTQKDELLAGLPKKRLPDDGNGDEDSENRGYNQAIDDVRRAINNKRGEK